MNNRIVFGNKKRLWRNSLIVILVFVYAPFLCFILIT